MWIISTEEGSFFPQKNDRQIQTKQNKETTNKQVIKMNKAKQKKREKPTNQTNKQKKVGGGGGGGGGEREKEIG